MRRAEIDGLVVIARTAVALGAMAGLADGFAAVPERMAEIGLWASAGNLGLQALGAIVFMGLGLQRALTVSLLTGNRTVALIFAALGSGGDPVVASFLSWSFLGCTRCRWRRRASTAGLRPSSSRVATV